MTESIPPILIAFVSSGPPKAPAYQFPIVNQIAYVYSVYDGDTVTILAENAGDHKIYQLKVRLADIDAPEIKDKGLATVAKKRLQELILHKYVVCIKSPGNDMYGRYLAHLYTLDANGQRADRSVNTILLEEGLAQSYNGGKKKPFNSDHSTNDTPHPIS